MVNFIFEKKEISQHVVKYGVDVRPPVVPKSDREKMVTYCNWLTDKFPAVFETVLSGPDKVLVQKTFSTSDNKQLEFPTFVLTKRGLVYTFPIKVLVEDIEDFDVPQKDQIFRKALKEFRRRFPERRIPRVGVVNEMVFDCGGTNSVEIVSDALSKGRWKRNIGNIKLHIENPREDKNINFDIEPVIAQQVKYNGSGTRPQNIGFGIGIKLDINNRDMTGNLTEPDVTDILAFSQDYLSDELIGFLNNERQEE